ncbi:MAG: hypothetical protein H8E32_11120 [Nitrospinae bacterium]|nr:hypothetical protein [Nitrospinota bacterium]
MEANNIFMESINFGREHFRKDWKDIRLELNALECMEDSFIKKLVKHVEQANKFRNKI